MPYAGAAAYAAEVDAAAPGWGEGTLSHLTGLGDWGGFAGHFRAAGAGADYGLDASRDPVFFLAHGLQPSTTSSSSSTSTSTSTSSRAGTVNVDARTYAAGVISIGTAVASLALAMGVLYAGWAGAYCRRHRKFKGDTDACCGVCCWSFKDRSSVHGRNRRGSGGGQAGVREHRRRRCR